jgi:hypothetical protein
VGGGAHVGGGRHASRITHVVEQLLQVLVADGRSGLAGPPPRHAPPPSFRSLEQEIAHRFPALAEVAYPAVLQALYAHVLPGLDCGIVQFQASPPDAPVGELRALVLDSWEPEAIAGQGLLAIADDGNDGGPLCLDSRAGGAPEGWPVVLWDHDWEQVTATLYSSAERMLACVIHWLQEGRVAGLAAIDPQGSAATYYDFYDE